MGLCDRQRRNCAIDLLTASPEFGIGSSMARARIGVFKRSQPRVQDGGHLEFQFSGYSVGGSGEEF
ncbi:hypothetical protein TIFTF001_031152 [Ficus carica]|uniref:Uncharacterized protein n=1 Tax=Ficus carica TaxID=3494 RepID=A0AA88DUV5_FICCA|nr:hypothetical protein TIFTF001_031152 [Ficus carica]